MQENRRKSGRRPLNYPAKIVASDGSWDRDCRMVDVSAGGARLVVAEPLDLPADFTLALGPIARKCQLRWNEDCEVGVLFVREPAAA